MTIEDPGTPPVAAPTPPAETDDLGLSLDMLDADRLRDWARLLLVHGADISHWGSVPHVAGKMQILATNIEQAVRDIGNLRLSRVAAPTPHQVAHRGDLTRIVKDIRAAETVSEAVDVAALFLRVAAPTPETPSQPTELLARVEREAREWRLHAMKLRDHSGDDPRADEAAELWDNAANTMLDILVGAPVRLAHPPLAGAVSHPQPEVQTTNAVDE